MTAGPRRALATFLAAVTVLVISATPMHAADGEEDRPLELWLDRPLPEDVAEGIEIPIGMMVWDRLEQALVTDNELTLPEAREYSSRQPRTGAAPPARCSGRRSSR